MTTPKMPACTKCTFVWKNSNRGLGEKELYWKNPVVTFRVSSTGKILGYCETHKDNGRISYDEGMRLLLAQEILRALNVRLLLTRPATGTKVSEEIGEDWILATFLADEILDKGPGEGRGLRLAALVLKIAKVDEHHETLEIGSLPAPPPIPYELGPEDLLEEEEVVLEEVPILLTKLSSKPPAESVRTVFPPASYNPTKFFTPEEVEGLEKAWDSLTGETSKIGK